MQFHHSELKNEKKYSAKFKDEGYFKLFSYSSWNHLEDCILAACTILQFLAHCSCRNLYGAKRGPQSSSWGLLNVENSAKKNEEVFSQSENKGNEKILIKKYLQ